MLKTHFITGLLIVISLAGCSKTVKQDGTISMVDVNGHSVTFCETSKVTAEETIPLSSLVESCEVIHFENIDDALFNHWMTTVSDNYIGIRQHGGPFKLFDRKGKFLHDIGKIGHGPGEYSISIYDEIIDEKNQRIYLAPFMGEKIMVYRLDGNHIKDIKLPFRANKPKIHLSDNGLITLIHMPFPDDEIFALQMDADGNILKKLAPTDKMRVSNFDGEIFSNKNSDNFDFMMTSLDTLYHINTENLTLVPKFTASRPSNEEGWALIMTELPNRYFANVFNWKQGGGMLISTEKNSLSSTKVTIKNDYYGNMNAPLTFNKGYFVYNQEPGRLITNIEKRMAESSCTEQDKEKLNSLLSTFDENSNNLLFIGKLKQ